MRARPTKTGVVLAAIAVAAGAAQLAGLTPIVLAAIALVAPCIVATRRWSAPFGIAVGFTTWVTAIFAILTVATWLPWDAGVETALGLVALTIAAALLDRAPTSDSPSPQRSRVPVVASAAGSLVWAGGLLWSSFMPGGGAQSWSIYNDSTLDAWMVRGILQSGGVDAFDVANPRPLEHALTASMVGAGIEPDGSAQTMAAVLDAHAGHWAITIALVSFFAGLTVVALGRRAGVRTPILAVGAAATSLAMLLTPVVGPLIDMGQINSHLVIALLLAAVLVATESQRAPLAAASTLVGLSALLVIVWTPFAAVPALLVMPLLPAVRRAWRFDRDRALARLLPGAALFAWIMTIYGIPVLRSILTADAEVNYRRVTTKTFSREGYWEAIINPTSLALTSACVVGTFALAALLWRGRRDIAVTVGITAAGLVLGFLPFVAAGGGLVLPLDYYPAKYVALGTITLLPVLAGLAAASIAGARATSLARVVAGVASLALLAGAWIAVPTPHEGESALLPLTLVEGTRYGPDEVTTERLVAYASNEELRVPWDLDTPYDAAVLLMTSSFAPDVPSIVLQDYRYVLRYFRNDYSADVACELSASQGRPLVLETSDAALADNVRKACANERITVVVTDPFSG